MQTINPEIMDLQAIATGAARLAMLLESANSIRMNVEAKGSLEALCTKLQAVAEESAFLVATLVDPSLGSLSDISQEAQNTAAELLASLERAGFMEDFSTASGGFGIRGEMAWTD